MRKLQSIFKVLHHSAQQSASQGRGYLAWFNSQFQDTLIDHSINLSHSGGKVIFFKKKLGYLPIELIPIKTVIYYTRVYS